MPPLFNYEELDTDDKKLYLLRTMPSIKISNQTSLSPVDCYKRVTSMLDQDPQLRKLDPSYKCEFNEKDLTGQAQGKQFKALLKISPLKNDPQSGSLIELTVELPFHLALVRGLVQKTLEEKLSHSLS